MVPEPDFARGTLPPVDPDGAVCYVLGAGFSKATRFALPVSLGFLDPRARVFSEGVDGTPQSVELGAYADLPKLLDRLEGYYGPLQDVNLEAVMTDLYTRAFGIGQSWTSHDHNQLTRRLNPTLPPDPQTVDDPRHDFELLLKYIELRLRVTECAQDDCPKAKAFVTVLNKLDSVVTLNYDTIVEKHLHGPATDRLESLAHYIGPPGSTYGCVPPAMFTDGSKTNRGVLVKVHGSVDWLTCPNEHCPNHAYIQPSGAWYHKMYHRSPNARCTTCGAVPIPVIIPPTAAKPFERYPKLNLMWLQAFHALCRSQRWTFIGVSFAPADFHLASLIRAASYSAVCMGTDPPEGGHICVVDKDYDTAEDCARRLLDCLSPRHRNSMGMPPTSIGVFRSVEEYLQAAETVDAERQPLPES